MDVSGQFHIPAASPLGNEFLAIRWIEIWVGPEDVRRRKFFTLPGLELILKQENKATTTMILSANYSPSI
jgi:hypothetical protein